ncbi:carboxypeptidase-like regulatory domain-containing protein, partial [Patescibacteria group bacterium]
TVGKAVEQIAEEEAVTTTANAVALSAGVATSASLAGGLQPLASRLLLLSGGLFRRRRKAPWGIVYDSETKQPLDPAYVVLKNAKGDIVGESITDMDGRYGFIAPPGQYSIEVSRTNYTFPSQKLITKQADILYNNLYHGGSFTVSAEHPVAWNIPLDPLSFDWNEFAKQTQHKFRVSTKRDRARIILFNTLFFAGAALSIYLLATNPTTINVIMTAGYIVLYLVQRFVKHRHTFTRLVDSKTNKAIPFAVIKAYLAGNDVLVKKVVTDEQGRFYMLIPTNSYYFTVEAHQPDGTYKVIHKTAPSKVRKGAVVRDLRV